MTSRIENSATSGPDVAPLNQGLKTENLRAMEAQRLLSPRQMKENLPLSSELSLMVAQEREAIIRILKGEDRRLLIVVGPCSIHDPEAALDYAAKLVALRRQVADRFNIVMRVYFEKPRTTVGWKGLINDPYLNDSGDVSEGLNRARDLLIKIVGMGLPAATEFLDPVVPQYIADLVAWAAIGARTTESQRHREMASGLSMPVGFKNGTDGDIQIALDAMRSSKAPHSFLGIDNDGVSCVIRTLGNLDTHLILRGGRQGTNYHSEVTLDAAKRLRDVGLPEGIMVDCSHANSNKNPALQSTVFKNILEQRSKGASYIIGAMIESFIHSGNQPIHDPAELKYGVSVTDPCIDWETTRELILEGAEFEATPVS